MERYFTQSKWTASIIANLDELCFLREKKIIVNTVDTFQDFCENMDWQRDEDKAISKYVTNTFEKLTLLLAKTIFFRNFFVEPKGMQPNRAIMDVENALSHLSIGNDITSNMCNFFSLEPHFL